MTTEQVPGQMSMTAGEIRDALDRIESERAGEDSWMKPLLAIEDAKLIRDLADRLISEQVAEARTVENKNQRVRLEAGDAGEVGARFALADHGTARDKRVYGWDVIGRVLRISGEAARQRYGR